MPCECADPDWCVTCLRKRLLTPRKVTFTRVPEGAEGYWEVEVDGEVVCDTAADDMDIAACSFEPLWHELNVEVEFVDDEA